MRRYRDNYLKSTPEGQAAVREYYDIAPGIVAAVNARRSAKEIWERVYEELVLPCVRLIEEARNEEAFRLYRDYTLALAAQGVCTGDLSA